MTSITGILIAVGTMIVVFFYLEGSIYGIVKSMIYYEIRKYYSLTK